MTPLVGRDAELLREAGTLEREGRTADAVATYESAIAAAEQAGNMTLQAVAQRLLAVQRYHRGETGAAQALCGRSLAMARRAGDGVLAAEALNTLGCVYLGTGTLDLARSAFLEALQVGAASAAVRARVEQNLGILANIQGRLDEALWCYRRSLDAYRRAEDLHGCAIAYNNLGLVSDDQGQLDEADRYFGAALELASRVGDAHLRALCLVNRADVDLQRQRYENARQGAEEALALFERLGAHGARADCYRVLGIVHRETGRHESAERRLRQAMETAVAAGNVLAEAEAAHELALLQLALGRNREALHLLNSAHGLFRRLDARGDLVRVAGRVAELEATYLTVVRAWGSSIEATDPAMYGHCERVAETAVAMSRALGLGGEDETAILLGAYLHDVGLVRVPREVLTRPSPLSAGEVALVQAHPLRGVELLEGVEFPWEIKPIIRWHHERWDGSGYPDGLRGDAIPLGAQIVGIAEAYDAVRAPRGGGPPVPAALARERIAAISGAWWSPRVVRAFLAATACAAGEAPAA